MGNAHIFGNVSLATTKRNGVYLTSPPRMHDPNPNLIEKAQGGDGESLKRLLEEIAPSVKRWALAHTGDPDSASDLSQDVFILVLKRLGSYRGDARFLTWLFTVTRNQALEAIRKRGRHEKKMTRLKTEIGWEPGASQRGGVDVDQERLRGIVKRFLEELPPRQREVFQMADVEGLTSPEIGIVLRLKPGSVRAALLKARRTLRGKILLSHPEFVEEYLP